MVEKIVKCPSFPLTAPSGANKQPWTFCIVTDAEIKKKIREAAEKEESGAEEEEAGESDQSDDIDAGVDDDELKHLKGNKKFEDKRKRKR